MQANVYGRRRRLENVLIEATSRLPDRCGFSRERLQFIRSILTRKIPTEEWALAYDDMDRRRVVRELMDARVRAGYERPEEKDKWNYIVEMRCQTHMPLWQQREYIVATLKKRRDNETISQSALPNHAHEFSHEVLHGIHELMDVPLTEAANTWLKESAALRRLLSETLKEADRGGIERGKIAMLERAFSSSNGGRSELSRQQRRDALIYVLRARRRAGLEGRPELNDEWGLMELLPLTGLTSKELDELVEKDDVVASVEMDGELTAFSLSNFQVSSILSTALLHFYNDMLLVGTLDD